MLKNAQWIFLRSTRLWSVFAVFQLAIILSYSFLVIENRLYRVEEHSALTHFVICRAICLKK